MRHGAQPDGIRAYPKSFQGFKITYIPKKISKYL